jgi:ABC-2 type transport system permease protein
VTLWRLEWLRLVRTRRWLAVAGLLLLSGLVSPVTVRYLTDFLERFGPQDIQITVPPPTPAEGMREYVGNALQLGVLALVLVAASSLAIDSRPEIGVFLRSRVASVGRLVWPRFVVMATLGAGGFVLGALAAWYETEVLLGPLPVGRTLAGIATGALFEVFVVAVVVYASGRTAGYAQTALLAVVLVFLLPLLENVGALRPWLPSRLAANLMDVDRHRSLADYLRPTAVTLALVPALLALGIRGLEKREL